ncbi:MAG TPA: winged helix-turn-helix domain-containing protein [Wenzhouxiangellaceae bacterium]|nr:winged helix-turn-helix domain-containing protein [Wenzhouxiangellaceae bacterium]
MRYTFDRFELDPELHRLTGADNRQITLRPQAFKVLEYLVRRAPSVVSRDELLKGVWGHNALSASGVAQAIREIRRALDDDATQPHIVATRHGCGYQVVATVIAHEITGEAVATPNEAPVARAHSPLATMAVFGLLLIGLVAGSYWFRPVPDGLRPSDGQFAALARIEGLSMPEGAEARAAFVQGVNAMRGLEWIQAAERFTTSLESDSESVAARLGLVDAYLRAGYEARARDLINHPSLQLGNLSRRGRLEVRAQLARLSGDWEEVAHCMRSLTEFFPRQLDYHYALFEALLASAPPALARPVLERIRRIQPQETPGARYFLALHALSLRDDQPADALAAARMALDEAKSGGQAALYAYAEAAHGRSLARIDRLVEAGESFGRAAEAMRSAHDESGRAEVQLAQASLEFRQDRLEKVRPLMAPACRILSEIRSGPGMARCTRLEGELMAAQGDLTAARSLLGQSVAGFERAGSLNEAAEVSLQLAHHQIDAGNLGDAADNIVIAGDLFERIGHRAGYAWVRYATGLLLHRQGKIIEARIAYSDAYVVFRGLSDRAGEAVAARAMAKALILEGKLARASELLDKAVALYQSLKDRPALAETLFAAGMLAERTGNLESAERHLGEAADLLLATGRKDRATLAFAELSRVFIDQARAENARAALAEAAALQPVGAGYRASLNSAAGYLALLECDRDQAEQLFTASRTLRDGLGAQLLNLQSKLDHARLFIERGRPHEAELAARDVVDYIGGSESKSLVANGFVILVQSLHLQGRPNEARQELVRMDRLGLVNASVKVDLAYQILLGKMDMVADPSAHLRTVRQRANETGYRLLALETDVALASKLLGSGQTGEGRELATAVIERARQTGMIYVAERAMRLNMAPSESGLSLKD